MLFHSNSAVIIIHKTYILSFFKTDLGLEWRHLLYPSLSIWADDKKRTCPQIRDLLPTTAPVPDRTVSVCKTSAPQNRWRKERPVTPMFWVPLCVKTQLHLYWLLMSEAHFWLLYMELLGIQVIKKIFIAVMMWLYSVWFFMEKIYKWWTLFCGSF